MHKEQLEQILNAVLQLNLKYDEHTLLYGAIAEFDSASVVALINALEDQFAMVIDDEDITAEVFASFGSLNQFIEQKIGSIGATN